MCPVSSCVASMASEPFSHRLDPNDSVLLGSERVKDIEALLAKGDNVVLLSNHALCEALRCQQTEATNLTLRH